MAELDLDVQLQRGARTFRHRLRSDARRIGIQGPSGSGKTTLLRILAGLEPARGRLLVRGRVLLDARVSVPPWERRVGWMPQDALLFPHVDVLANLRWSGAGREEATAVAQGLGIAHLLGRRSRHLSGGERQRVALGRALLAASELLLLDEPFTALNPELRASVQAFLTDQVAARDLVLVLVAHDLGAGSPVDEVWDLRDGDLVPRGG